MALGTIAMYFVTYNINDEQLTTVDICAMRNEQRVGALSNSNVFNGIIVMNLLLKPATYKRI